MQSDRALPTSKTITVCLDALRIGEASLRNHLLEVVLVFGSQFGIPLFPPLVFLGVRNTATIRNDKVQPSLCLFQIIVAASESVWVTLLLLRMLMSNKMLLKLPL